MLEKQAETLTIMLIIISAAGVYTHHMYAQITRFQRRVGR